MSAASNAGQIAYWNGPIGKTWAAAREKRDRDHAAITKTLLELAAPQPGEKVLDIGCGSGTTTLLLAERVGRSGRVLGIDISAPMLEAAVARAAKTAGIAQFVEGDATDHPFESQGFDLAFSQLGVMFFADPIASFRNIHRAVKPGGRIVFACWRHPFEHLWAWIPESAAKPFLPPAPAADWNAPGRYAFHDPDRVKSVLLQAGFHAPVLQKFDARTFAGATPEEAAASAIDAGPLQRTLADADEPTRTKVRAAVIDRLRKEMAPGGIYLTSAAWLVQAHAHT